MNKKLDDYMPACIHPEHNPPSMRVYQPGMHVHVCPCCGKKTVFTVKDVKCYE